MIIIYVMTTYMKEINDNKHVVFKSGNPGFQAFLVFKKHVANKLKISNGPAAAKIAGSINAEMKKKHSELCAVEIAKKNTEYFDKNMDKVKYEFNDLISKSSVKHTTIYNSSQTYNNNDMGFFLYKKKLIY